MARPQILPNADKLLEMVQAGMTHTEIAQQVARETGYPVSRAAVSVALSRAGLTEEKPRYAEEIPWRLHGKDLKHYGIRMLRLLGKRRAGEELTPDENTRLTNWLDKLDEEDAVVAYCADSVPRIIYVPREDSDPKDIPIRRKPVFLHYPED